MPNEGKSRRSPSYISHFSNAARAAIEVRFLRHMGQQECCRRFRGSMPERPSSGDISNEGRERIGSNQNNKGRNETDEWIQRWTEEISRNQIGSQRSSALERRVANPSRTRLRTPIGLTIPSGPVPTDDGMAWPHGRVTYNTNSFERR